MSGARYRILHAGVAALLLLLPTDLAASDRGAEGWRLTDLLAAFRGVRSAKGHFVEYKYVGIVNEPLESSGTLSYQAPDQLEKITTAPFYERLSLDGDTFVGQQGEGGEIVTLPLSQHEDIATIVEGMRATLAGDQATLEQYYNVALEGDRSNWRLVIVPKSRSIHRVVQSVVLVGSGASLISTDMRQLNGDRTVITITQDGG